MQIVDGSMLDSYSFYSMCFCCIKYGFYPGTVFINGADGYYTMPAEEFFISQVFKQKKLTGRMKGFEKINDDHVNRIGQT